ncbi:MAG TPA: sugar phosphate nucleotidyltransferase [Candidatus Saccharimonadales bacterium]|nr:sugar phosphate nucleotidyltransferase [Candidatus Saccharimonadales bacterium]
MAQKPIRKAVIAAAGFGTRFLPQTKAMPKEMLPVVDKPIIQYVVEELVNAGIEDIIVVTGYSKRAIEDHFDNPSQDLVSNLKNGGKDELLDQIKKIANLANFVYVRQKGPYGNATPLLNAEHLIGGEPFIYTWGDDFILSSPPRFSQLVRAYDQTKASAIFACLPAKHEEDYKRYAFVGGSERQGQLLRMERIIEKPGSRESSPSNLASLSGYVFDSKIFDYIKQDLEKLEPKHELIFQPSVQRMMDDGLDVYACEIDGTYYDTGNKLEYLKTVVDFALMHDDIKDDFADYLRHLTL